MYLSATWTLKSLSLLYFLQNRIYIFVHIFNLVYVVGTVLDKNKIVMLDEI